MPLRHLYFLVSLLLALALAGCGTQASKPDTRTWTTLTCSGFLLWKDCWQEAQKLCPDGFDIANQIELRGPQKREVEVACKPG